MKLSKISLPVLAALFLAACTEGFHQQSITFNCAPGELACSLDGKQLLTCKDNVWEAQDCSKACVITNNTAQCVLDETPEPSPSQSDPITDQICTADGSIQYTYKSGKTETKTCLEAVGFETKCVTNIKGAECEIPSSCDDTIFTELGTCLGQNIAYCDQSGTPHPAIQDCNALGRVCAEHITGAACYDTCESTAPEFSCTQTDNAEQVVHCAASGEARIVVQRDAICDNNEAISCVNGEIKRTVCDSASVCVASRGTCEMLCHESEVGTIFYDKNGKTKQCTKIEENLSAYYVYVPIEDPILARICTDDGKLQTTYQSGRIETKSCLEEVGIDTQCITYNNKLAGCEMPSTCDDTIFTDQGTCLGQRRAYCDETFTTPYPAIRDCNAVGRVCAAYLNGADCYETCNDEAPEFSCTKSDNTDQVVHCVASGNTRILAQSASICDKGEVVSCVNGKISRNPCDSDSLCISSLGVCATLCSESELNKVICDQNGQMTQCQKVEDNHSSYYVYISVGKRECTGTTLNICEGSNIKQTDCYNQVFTSSSGEILSEHGKCTKDLQYYEDYDVCTIAYDGEPCGSVTEAGSCNGSTLTYCYVDDNIITTSNCAASIDGFTSCTVYAGYADCRQPCTKPGEAICTPYTDDLGETSYTLALCVTDEADPSKASYLIAQAGCIGDTLYTCNGPEATKIDCAANGGVCSSTSCQYPVCGISSSNTCSDGLMCSVDSNGAVQGLTTCL